MPTKRVTGGTQQDLTALNEVVQALRPLDPSERQRVLQMVRLYFDTDPLVTKPAGDAAPQERIHFSTALGQSPKEFLLEKRPTSDIERVACLAFYLSHFQDRHQFGTKDISALNSEAKQAPFGNAAQAMKNAQKKGFVVAAGKAAKQLSAVGEQFVIALPNREEAVAAFRSLRPRARKGQKSRKA